MCVQREHGACLDRCGRLQGTSESAAICLLRGRLIKENLLYLRRHQVSRAQVARVILVARVQRICRTAASVQIELIDDGSWTPMLQAGEERASLVLGEARCTAS